METLGQKWTRWHKAHLEYHDYLPGCYLCQEQGLVQKDPEAIDLAQELAEGKPAHGGR